MESEQHPSLSARTLTRQAASQADDACLDRGSSRPACKACDLPEKGTA